MDKTVRSPDANGFLATVHVGKSNRLRARSTGASPSLGVSPREQAVCRPAADELERARGGLLVGAARREAGAERLEGDVASGEPPQPGRLLAVGGAVKDLALAAPDQQRGLARSGATAAGSSARQSAATSKRGASNA